MKYVLPVGAGGRGPSPRPEPHPPTPQKFWRLVVGWREAGIESQRHFHLCYYRMKPNKIECLFFSPVALQI